MQGIFDVLNLKSGIRHSETAESQNQSENSGQNIQFIKDFKNSILPVLLSEKYQVMERKVMAW